MDASRVIVIPTGEGAENVVIPAADLPADVNEIIEVLTSVSAPMTLWLEVLIEYWRQGKVSQFDELLRKVLPLPTKCPCGRPARKEGPGVGR